MPLENHAKRHTLKGSQSSILFVQFNLSDRVSYFFKNKDFKYFQVFYSMILMHKK